MVDLKAQYDTMQAAIDEAVINVIRSTAFIKGPEVKAFESELATYLDAKHVIGCANGTDALQIAMMALGFQPGDEIILPNFTYVATAEVIALLGLKPVLVDVLPDTMLVDPKAVEEAVTDKTVAIVPVHLFGQVADMDAIMRIAHNNNLKVIEDTAQAIGADYHYADGTTRKAGTIGDIGCTSFFPSKNLGCYGDGGALFTNDDTMAERIRMVANHGQKVQYYHDVVGVNSRLDSIQAAILRIKLPQLDAYAAARNKAADAYDQAFANIEGLQTPVREPSSNHVFHQYTLQVQAPYRRDDLRQYLAELEIPSMVYYPVPLHFQEAYKDEERYSEGDFPVTEQLCAQVISLPMHTELDQDQLDYIIEGVQSFFQQA